VIKTRGLIREAFVKLVDEKGFKSITVNDISDKAMINRSTFYLHYKDKFDLLEKIVDEAIQNILFLVEPQAHIVNGILDYEGFLNNLGHIMRTVESDALLYKFILNDKEMLGITRKYENAVLEKLNASFPLQLSISRDLCLELITSIYVSTIRWWLNSDMNYSPSFLAKELVEFFKSGSSGLLKQSE
jgi:Transcriptional regulator